MDDLFVTNLMNFFSVNWVIWAFIAVYTALIIADLIKRHTLSNGAVWYSFMLTMPLVLIYEVFFIALALFNGATSLVGISTESHSILETFGAITSVVILTVLMLTIYIRGNIFPLNKFKIENLSKRQKSLATSKRLIIIGIAGTTIYFAVFVLVLSVIISYMGEITLTLLPIMTILLFIPVLNIISFVYFGCLGAVGMVITVIAIGAAIEFILLINGCMRYSIAFQKTKPMKVLWSFLSIIPFFNVGLGIYYLVASKKLTE